MDPLPRPIRKPASLFSAVSRLHTSPVLTEAYLASGRIQNTYEPNAVCGKLSPRECEMDKLWQTDAEVARGPPLSPPQLLQRW